MRTRHTRTAAAGAALACGVLAAVALRPSAHATQTLAARNPAVEVRTEVIRRTVHVSGRGRHGIAPIPGRAGTVGVARPGAPHGAATRTSRSHAGSSPTHSASPVATRSSPGHSSPGPPVSSAAHPVSTRTSPGHASSGQPSSGGQPTSASHPVSTRTSPGHASSSGTGSSGRPVSTHSSGSHHGDDGGDRGDD